MSLPPTLAMGIAEEYRLTMVAALGNMMRPAGHDYASNSWHHLQCFARGGFISQILKGHW